MAEKANDEGIGFSFLHIISDNISTGHRENLSNERDEKIIQKRSVLYPKLANKIVAALNSL